MRSRQSSRSCAEPDTHDKAFSSDRRLILSAAAAAALAPGLARAQATPGVTATEIKIGTTTSLSGPVSALGTINKTQAAYFKMLNEQGGINGRKVNLVSLDDGYSPPKTLEQTRKLVEQDEVLAVVGSLGTPTNAAIQKYLTAKKIPHLLLATGASRWNDPKEGLQNSAALSVARS